MKFSLVLIIVALAISRDSLSLTNQRIENFIYKPFKTNENIQIIATIDYVKSINEYCENEMLNYAESSACEKFNANFNRTLIEAKAAGKPKQNYDELDEIINSLSVFVAWGFFASYEQSKHITQNRDTIRRLAQGLRNVDRSKTRFRDAKMALNCLSKLLYDGNICKKIILGSLSENIKQITEKGITKDEIMATTQLIHNTNTRRAEVKLTNLSINKNYVIGQCAE